LIGENMKSKNYTLGNNVTLLGKVKIGKGSVIGNNVVIYKNSIIGKNVDIKDNSVIGRPPQSSPISTRKVRRFLPPIEIGDGTIIGCSCVLYSGTKIGKKCMVGDLAGIRESCKIDDFVIIGRATTVECNTKIGMYTKIQTACHLTGDMLIEDHVFFGPEVTTVNDKYMGRGKSLYVGPCIKRGARIGGNATILAGVTIGKDSVIGAGAVVVSDIPDYSVAVGVPARVIKEVPKEQRLPK
jgi:UDP-2-acetamido-3-amino-2,3-dideoxy-glucuronate N-acetyltransferase